MKRGYTDPVRRATGFYGNPDKNIPVEKMNQLNAIYKENCCGSRLIYYLPRFKESANSLVDSYIILRKVLLKKVRD
jgi:hypothetical protein